MSSRQLSTLCIVSIAVLAIIAAQFFRISEDLSQRLPTMEADLMAINISLGVQPSGPATRYSKPSASYIAEGFMPDDAKNFAKRLDASFAAAGYVLAVSAGQHDDQPYPIIRCKENVKHQFVEAIALSDSTVKVTIHARQPPLFGGGDCDR